MCVVNVASRMGVEVGDYEPGLDWFGVLESSLKVCM